MPAQSQYVVNERAGVALPIAAISRPSTGASGDTIQTRAAHPLPMRAIIASLGWIAGAYIVGSASYEIRPHHCQCDDPGLAELIQGAVVGGALGAALGAAGPDLGTQCSLKTRIGRSLVGAIAGTAIGLLPYTEGAGVITVPVFTVVGATIAERRC